MKKISLYMAFIMILTTISVFGAVEDKDLITNDSNFKLNHNFLESLKPTNGNDIPVTNTLPGETDALLSFPMNKVGSSGNSSTSTNILSFFVEDSLELKLTVTKTSDKTAEVGYQLIELDKSSLEIFSGSTNKYIPYTTYNNSYNDPTRDTCFDNSKSYPYFKIVPGTGFSFKYNGVENSILWDEKSGEFKFSYGGFNKGFVYDIGLKTYNNKNINLATIGYSTSKKIISGLDTDKFNSIPFASKSNNNPADKVYKDYILLQPNGGTSNDDANPGTKNLGIEFSLALPLELDPATKKYTKVLDNSNNLTISMMLESTGAGSQYTKQINLVDALQTSPSANNADVVKKDNLLNVTINNMDPGIIYDDVAISLIFDSKDNIYTRSEVKLDSNKIYTLPKYKIVVKEGKCYVIFTPFKGMPGEYVLLSGLGSTGMSPSVTQKSDGKSDLTFPTRATTENQFEYFYKVIFNPNNQNIDSQMLKYKPIGSDGDISAPNNFTVVDYNLTTINGVNNNEEMNLTMKLRWDIGYKSQILAMLDASDTNTITVDYILGENLTSTINDINPFGNIKLDITRKGNDILVTYSSIDSLGLSDHQAIVTNTDQEELKFTFRADANEDMFYAEVDLEYKAGGANTNLNDLIFRYPNIYFLTVRANTLDRNTALNNNPMPAGNQSYSNFKSITLNGSTDNIVPPPQNINITDITSTTNESTKNLQEVSFKLNWHLTGSNLREYLRNIYVDSKLKDILSKIDSSKNEIGNDLKTYYNIYISTDEKLMRNAFGKYPYEDPTASTRKNSSEELKYVSAGNNKIFLSDINGSVANNTVKGNKPISVLRDGKILRISEVPLKDGKSQNEILQEIYNNPYNLDKSIIIDGLDQNSKYYVYVDLVVEHMENLANGTNENKVEWSLLSPLVGATTKATIDIPDFNNKIPTTPIIQLIKTEVDHIITGWNKVFIVNDEGVSESVEYQIIRLKDSEMDKKYLDTRDSFTHTWNNYLPKVEKKGYETSNSSTTGESPVYPYLEAGTGFSTTPATDVNYSKSSEKIEFNNSGLDANTVYFYYVRSVKKGKDADGNATNIYSTWSRISGTTTNAKAPINLKIDSSANYDVYKETVLNFEAAVKDLTTLGNSVNLQYSFKEENGKWSDPITMDPNFLKSSAGNLNTDGYRPFSYKITGLEQGKTYTFKVRLIDSTGQPSMYSNEVVTKTDIDQEEYDKEINAGKWYDYLKSLLEETINDEYWLLKDSNTVQEILYREDKLQGLLSNVSEKTLTLVEAKGDKENIYYLPAKALEEINNRELGIRIVYENVEFYLSPKAVSSVLSAANEYVNKNDTSDYYVKIDVNGYNYTSVNGEPTLSDRITFDIGTVGFNKSIAQWENESYNSLINLLKNDSKINDIKTKIFDKIAKEETNVQLQDYILSAKDDLKVNFMNEVQSTFNKTKSSSKFDIDITSFDNPMVVSLLDSDSKTAVNGFMYLKSQWVQQKTLKLGSKNTMSVLSDGIFIFTGKKISLDSLKGIEGIGNITDIYSKYSLDKYLGNGESFNPEANLNKTMVYGTVANLLGAKTGDDPVEFLKNSGITVSSRNSNSAIRVDDTIDLLMKVYEKKSNTNIDKFNITNYSATKNMANVSGSKFKSIQVATQLNLISNPSFDGSATLSVKEYLELINKLNKIIKL